jgi:hypothetical protein
VHGRVAHFARAFVVANNELRNQQVTSRANKKRGKRWLEGEGSERNYVMAAARVQRHVLTAKA